MIAIGSHNDIIDNNKNESKTNFSQFRNIVFFLFLVFFFADFFQ